MLHFFFGGRGRDGVSFPSLHAVRVYFLVICFTIIIFILNMNIITIIFKLLWTTRAEVDNTKKISSLPQLYSELSQTNIQFIPCQ